MFGRRDPLEDWTLLGQRYDEVVAEGTQTAVLAARQAGQVATLRAIPDILALPKKERTAYQIWEIARQHGAMISQPVPLDEREITLADDLLMPVVEAGGPGTTQLQEYLLTLIGLSAWPGSVPALKRAATYSRARDGFRPQRSALATAALGRIFYLRQSREALDALVDLICHADKDDTRQGAAHSIVVPLHWWEEEGLAIPATLIAPLAALVTDDAAPGFVRSQVRRALSAQGEALPEPEPAAGYSVRVWHVARPRATRTIRLAAEDSLEDLHGFIQLAFEWDSDHLFSFYMAGYNNHFGEYRGPASYTDLEPGEQAAADITLGDLGLTAGQRFDYLFDYGDNHHFIVEVVAVHAEPAPDEGYGVVESVGEAIEQYPSWDDEEEVW